MWTAYDHDVKELVNLNEPELVMFADGQKTVLGESEETGKMLYRIISSEEAKHLQKINRGKNWQVHLY